MDPIDYPQYDANLVRAFQRETEMFVASTLREDRSVLELINADYTYVNERLAAALRDTGGLRLAIPAESPLPNLDQRGELLAQGSILSVSSYPDRTSPVLRGKWLMDNMLGMPPPPPPPGVDTNLAEVEQGLRRPSIKERLTAHRTNPVCNSCHGMIDPLGFPLENFDVIGGWRLTDERGNPVDAIGSMPSGEELDGFVGCGSTLRANSL